MLLIGRAMATLVRPLRLCFHDLVIQATRRQRFEMHGQHFIEWIISDEPDRCDFDHGPPSFAPLGFWQTNCQHDEPPRPFAHSYVTKLSLAWQTGLIAECPSKVLLRCECNFLSTFGGLVATYSHYQARVQVTKV